MLTEVNVEYILIPAGRIQNFLKTDTMLIWLQLSRPKLKTLRNAPQIQDSTCTEKIPQWLITLTDGPVS